MKKKFCILTNKARAIINFRLNFVGELLKSNFDVCICTPYEKDAFVELRKMGVTLLPVKINRISINPFTEFITLLKIYKIIIKQKPDFCMFYTIKPVIYGSLIARWAKVDNVFSIITGLGYVYIGNSWGKKIMQFFVNSLYKFALKSNKKVFFLNTDDLNYFKSKKLVKNERAHLLPGEGVDLDKYYISNIPSDHIVFLFSARLLKDKGIYEFIEAAKIINDKYQNVTFEVAGIIDANPASIKESELNNWIKNKYINYHGYLDDIRIAISKASVFVLPSYYREGIPVSILEAMSMGRPIITTNEPGCRETVIDGINGYLIPPKDVKNLVAAMEKFVLSPHLIKKMGRESRRLAEEKYDIRKVNKMIFEAMGI